MLFIGQIKNTEKENSAVFCDRQVPMLAQFWRFLYCWSQASRRSTFDRARYSFIHATQPAGYCIL